MLAELDEIRGEVDELRGLVRGRVSIGALLPAGEVEVTTLLASFNRAFPAIEVSLREGTAADLLELLEADRARRCLLAGRRRPAAEPSSSLQLSEEEVVAAYPPGGAPGEAAG